MREWLPTAVLLPGESHEQRSLIDYGPWDRKESDMTKLLTHTHSNYLHSIYIVLTRVFIGFTLQYVIINNLEVIWSMWEGERMCVDTMPFYMRLEHLWILLSLIVLEPFTPRYSGMTTSEAARDSRGNLGRGMTRSSFWTQKLCCVEWNGLTLVTALTLLSLGFSPWKSWYKNCS